MIPSSIRPISAESPRKKDVIGDGGVPGPMPQQDAGDCHGHDMHPQKLVQLVGCHDPHAENLKK